MSEMNLEMVWSTSEIGELQLEVVPSGAKSPSLAKFVFDRELIEEAVEEDMEDVWDSGPTDSIIEWEMTADYLENLAATIRNTIKEAVA